MIFKEIVHKPKFTLTMDLEEAIKLWRIVNMVYGNGDLEAKKFVDALTEFASNSNSYTHLLTK